MASPAGPTSMDAPGGRGADSNVATTVAIPTVRPSRPQPSSWGSTSRIRDDLQQLLESRDGVSRHEVVTVWQCRGHAELHGLVAGRTLVRVSPDHSMGESGQTLHL